MNKKTTHPNVPQMVREMSDAAFADAFEARLRSRRIVKDLMVLRAGRGLTQGDIASKMGCSQSRISKLESSSDFDLTLGDLVRYASAVGLRVGVVLEPKGTTVIGCLNDPEDGEPPIQFEIRYGEVVDSAAPPSEPERPPDLERSEKKRPAVARSG
jgi:transcriptional regulator with XRE-family HTH domain